MWGPELPDVKTHYISDKEDHYIMMKDSTGQNNLKDFLLIKRASKYMK